MKKSVYVVYEVYTDDFMNLNDEKEKIKYIKTLESERDMIVCLENEKNFQIQDNNGWSCSNKITDEYCAYTFYYCDEEQYKIIGKEVELV